MKKDEVILGGKYWAKVSGNLVEVRIDAVGRHGGWTATNLATHKTIHIKSAQRLRGSKAAPAKKNKPAPPKPASTTTEECPRGGKHDWTTEEGERFCSKCNEPTPKPAKKPTKKTAKLAIYVARPKGNAAKEAMDQVRKDTAERYAKTPEETTAATSATDSKKLSAINAAAKVLAESGEPMNAKEMIDAMTAKGYWTSPGGKTPHATLYSAIIREISVKASASRFAKTERGKFTFNANA